MFVFPCPRRWMVISPTACSSAIKLCNSWSGYAHVLRQPVLSRKAEIVVPRIAQKHGVGDLRANRDLRIFQNEIRDLGEPSACNRVARRELDIALDDRADRGQLSFAPRSPVWLAHT